MKKMIVISVPIIVLLLVGLCIMVFFASDDTAEPNNEVNRGINAFALGVVGLSEYSPLMDEDTRSAVEAAGADILAGRDVFSGEIFDNTGVLRYGEGETMRNEMLFSSFDWYEDGVVIYE